MTTYANWVAKTASLLAEEHDLERGQTLRIDLPPHWLGPVFLGAAWTAGLVVDRRRRRRTPSCAARTGSTTGRRRRRRAGARLLAAAAGRAVRRARCPTGVHDVGVEVWSQPTRSCRATRPSRRRRGGRPGPPSASCGTRPPPGVSSPTAAASSRRRTRLPHRARHLHRAARARRLAGPGRPRRPGAARGDVRRRARHGSLPVTRAATAVTGSADQVVLPIPPARTRACAKPVALAGMSEQLAGAFLRTTRSAWPVRSTSLTPTTQSYGARSTRQRHGVPVSPPGPLPG